MTIVTLFLGLELAGGFQLAELVKGYMLAWVLSINALSMST